LKYGTYSLNDKLINFTCEEPQDLYTEVQVATRDYSVKIVIYNEKTASLPRPLKLKYFLNIICALPHSFKLHNITEYDNEFAHSAQCDAESLSGLADALSCSRKGIAFVSPNSRYYFRAHAYDAYGRPFQNFSSLEVTARVQDKKLASVIERYPLESN
jgi:hypothetical protein